MPNPWQYSCLYCVSAVDGGDTSFASMHGAYDRLSPGMREMLSGMRAIHTGKGLALPVKPFVKAEKTEDSDDQVAKKPEQDGPVLDVDAFRTPVGGLGLEVSHPCIIEHPTTGRPALYVNRGFTLRFDGWTRAESRDLLNTLVDSATVDELVYTHEWTDGDLVMWDNRCVLHYATQAWDHAQPRILHRTTTHGFAPPGERGHQNVSQPPERGAVYDAPAAARM